MAIWTDLLKLSLIPASMGSITWISMFVITWKWKERYGKSHFTEHSAPCVQDSRVAEEWVSWRKLFSRVLQALKPWPNNTSNSSQVTKSKLASAGGQTVQPSRASSHENHSIVWLRPRSHLTIRKQLWRELAEVAKRWKLGLRRAKIWSWSNANQLEPSTIPSSSQVENLAGVGSSWEYRLAGA